MTLLEHLDAGAAFGRSAGATVDPAPACAASGVIRSDVVTQRDLLATVEDRCIISRLQREFLDRVLVLMP